VSLSLSIGQRRGSLTHFAHNHILLVAAVCVSLGGAVGVLFGQIIVPEQGTALPELESDDYRAIAYGAPPAHKRRSLHATPKCNAADIGCNPSLPVPKMNVEMGLKYAVQIVNTMEGTAMVSFLDTLASPHVWTIGHGTTRIKGLAVKQGMRCTQEQCDQWSMDDMRSAANYIVAHTAVALTDWQLGALISFTYNEGVGTFYDSTVREALNKGLYSIAADRLLEYDRAGGKRLRGLDTRRGRERAMFLGKGAIQFTTFIAPPVPDGVSELSDSDRLNGEQIAKFA
jgi:lysozyme